MRKRLLPELQKALLARQAKAPPTGRRNSSAELVEGPVPEEALEIFDVPREDVVPVPNGEAWPLHGSIDMDVLRQHWDATVHLDVYEISCEDLGSVAYMWLREDGYGEGMEAGPSCVGPEGGWVDHGGTRLIDYVCQAPNTTARTLVAPTAAAEGQGSVSFVFTPEHTTGDEWECFDFGGEQVEADQTVIEDAGRNA